MRYADEQPFPSFIRRGGCEADGVVTASQAMVRQAKPSLWVAMPIHSGAQPIA